ncbi:hypothetical protein Godav_015455 [Gossypium davidsonii]|uniref:Uncharacterized protein n=1 Tax=Gossypium davidsonii TaxID=34287 RepID=A0A7J8RNF3_GOSDV|nr:hypothetical protein [Gossypium davidsonii]
MENALANLHVDDGEEEAYLHGVVNSAPYMFNNHLLIFRKLKDKEDPFLYFLYKFSSEGGCVASTQKEEENSAKGARKAVFEE